MQEAARRAATLAARTSYGKLVAMLAARSRDIAAAEDALSQAFAKALTVWPEHGVPTNPDAWLWTVARNLMLNMSRHDRVRADATAEIMRRHDDRTTEDRPFADDRLALLFVCGHPAIDPLARTPLMLQTVLGMDAGRIGRAFMIAPAAMGQRLVRAKTKIREARIRFQVPEPNQLADRMPDVLAAIYAAFTAGWDAMQGDANTDLAEEALYLGRLMADLMPREPEALGLLSLMLFLHARRDARRHSTGGFVPLSDQDSRLWDRDMIIVAENLLTQAARFGRFGRYQCEAAIQSVHAQRPITGRLNLTALETLYRMLAAHVPTVGILVAKASVTYEQGNPDATLRQLQALDADCIAAYQPYWVLRAHALFALGDKDNAQQAAVAALRLTDDPSVHAYLAALFARLEATPD